MGKVEEAKQILQEMGLPPKQRNDRSALVLLALCQIRESDEWKNAQSANMSVVGNKNSPRYAGIMRFIAENYQINYAENSRETLRRQTIHQFVQAGIVLHNPENPGLPTNSKDNHYRIAGEALEAIRLFGTKKWKKALVKFIGNGGSLQEKYAQRREMVKIPLEISGGKVLRFSPGKHNVLQIAVIQEFAPRFAPASELLYIGDTAQKSLYIDKMRMQELAIPYDEHNKLPDILLLDNRRNWVFLIEVVTSHGPVSPKRLIELEQLLQSCSSGRIYVTAFPDFKTFRRYSNEIAWETEAWVAEAPEHMIHFNGGKFLGPR